MKLIKIFQALLLIIITSKISATTINCSFDNQNIPLGRTTTIQGYGCDILSITSGKPQTPIKFSGTHTDGNTDNDVTVIRYQIYDEYQLPRFDSSFCEKFSNIETIFISQLEILSVGGDALKNCKKLSKLYFYSNKIQKLPEDLLAENSNLTVLNLDFNSLTELPENIFMNLKELEDLGITNNQISFLPSNIFKSLGKLQFLRLGQNKITAIGQNLFNNLENLEILGLEQNQITKVPNKSFQTMSNLIDLNLSSNKITAITSTTFSGLKSLKALSLDYNKIEELPKNAFKDSPNLEVLTIAYNKLSTIHSDSFGALTKFIKLHCYSNEIESIDERLIDNTAVEDLDMSSNICFDGLIYGHDNMKNDLSECFENYQPRIEGNSSETPEKVEEITLVIEEDTTTTTSVPISTTISTKLSSTTQATTILEPVTTTTERSTTTTEELAPTTEKLTTTTKKLETTTSKPTIISSTTSRAVMSLGACGKPKVGLPTIVKGSAIVRGSFPWNAALLKTDGSFFCGGTLVSRNKVVSAAHCLKGKYQGHTYHASDVVIALGAHDLSKKIEIGRIIVAVKKINNHHDWNPNTASFDADIAVLELEDEVTLTKFIQPICLIQSVPEVESLMSGIVVGFGRSEEKNVENIARVINMPMYSYEECSTSKDHKHLLSQRTICGGHANGTGVCVGDSGGGLYVSHNNTYYLRGIVSASLHGDLYGCNVNAYAVFTDVIKFGNWIETGRDDESLSDQELRMILKKLGINSFDDLKNLKKFGRI